MLHEDMARRIESDIILTSAERREVAHILREWDRIHEADGKPPAPAKKLTIAERDALLGIGTKPYDISYFSGATPDTLRALLDGGVANAEDAQNNAPTYGEFVAWLEKHPAFTAHGYAVSEKRSDCRVSIEGIESGPVSQADLLDFIEFQRQADEFQSKRTGCRSWWD